MVRICRHGSTSALIAYIRATWDIKFASGNTDSHKLRKNVENQLHSKRLQLSFLKILCRRISYARKHHCVSHKENEWDSFNSGYFCLKTLACLFRCDTKTSDTVLTILMAASMYESELGRLRAISFVECSHSSQNCLQDVSFFVLGVGATMRSTDPPLVRGEA